MNIIFDAETVITDDGVYFVVTPALCDWVKTQGGLSYGLDNLDSIVHAVRSTFTSASYVELYGVRETERAYAKIFNDETSRETKWTLQFIGEVMWFAPL